MLKNHAAIIYQIALKIYQEIGAKSNWMDSPQLKRRRFKKIAAAAPAAAAALNALHITI
jgi:hypothetical protein